MTRILQLISAFSWRSILDIMIVTFVFYKAIVLIRGTRAEQLVKGLAVLIMITVISRALGLAALEWLLTNLMTVGIVAIPVVFQPELRRVLETLGRGKIFTRSNQLYAEFDFELMLEESLKQFRF